MTTKHVRVERFSVTSAKSFEEVVARLEAAVRHPDMHEFRRDVASARFFPWKPKVRYWTPAPDRRIFPVYT
jgi:hypothetical protein